MKHPFLKSALIVGAVMALMSCGDDAATTTEAAAPSDISQVTPVTDPSLNPNAQATGVATEACFQFDADQTYLISTSLVVTNASGEAVGVYDMDSQSIIAISGDVMFTGVVLTELTALTEGQTYTILAPASSASTPVAASSATIATSSAAVVTSSATAVDEPVAASSSSEAVVASSSSEVATVITDGNITITGPLEQTVAQTAKTTEIKVTGLSNEPSRLSWNAYFLETSYNDGTYTIKSATVPEYFEVGEVSEFFKIDGKDYEFKLNVTSKSGSSNNNNNNNNNQTQSSSSQQQQQQAKSSSSQAKSSSSQAKSSSSQQQQQQQSSSSATATATSSYSYSNTAAASEIKYVSGGKSGSGFASRYWDCCKPSCAWPGKGGTKAHACSVSGSILSDDGATSTCNGGNAGTCVSQIPMIVNDNLAYAYAAVPAKDGGQCGKCFALEFTGKGKYETKANHKALAGKTLIVMASNVGEDVAQGQFDVMIPGGGVGIYNGCSAYGWGDMGAQYGGLLTNCEKSAGTAGDIKTKRKECLAEKCASTFKNDPTAKEGCMFLATWMEAAGNPTHTYKEVECPAALTAKY